MVFEAWMICHANLEDLISTNITLISDAVIPYDTTELKLGQNLISKISANEMPDLPYLTQLNVANNFINEIADSAFLAVGILTYLSLYGNKLTRIGNMTFYGLGNLRCSLIQGHGRARV